MNKNFTDHQKDLICLMTSHLISGYISRWGGMPKDMYSIYIETSEQIVEKVFNVKKD